VRNCLGQRIDEPVIEDPLEHSVRLDAVAPLQRGHLDLDLALPVVEERHAIRVLPWVEAGRDLEVRVHRPLVDLRLI
jgi:hypothetical protein